MKFNIKHLTIHQKFPAFHINKYGSITMPISNIKYNKPLLIPKFEEYKFNLLIKDAVSISILYFKKKDLKWI